MSPKDFTWFNMATLCQKSTLGGADSSILKTPKVSSNLPCSLWGAQPYLGRTLSGQSEIVRCVAAAYAQDKPPKLPWYVVWRSIMDSWTNVSRTECRMQSFDVIRCHSMIQWFYMLKCLGPDVDCATLKFEYLAEGAPWTVEPTLGGQDAVILWFSAVLLRIIPAAR